MRSHIHLYVHIKKGGMTFQLLGLIDISITEK